MVKILDNIMIKVMMAVLTLSSTFDMCASTSERSYNAQHIGTAPSTDNYDKPNKIHPSEGPDFLPDYDFIFDGLYCHIYENDKNKVEITYQCGNGFLNKFYVAGDLIIPSSVKYEGKEYAVTGIGDYAFSNCVYVTSVTIPNSIRSIGKYAFFDCGFESIEIPSSVTSIADNAFTGCDRLQSIEIPNSVKEIGIGAFASCTSMISAKLPEKMTTLGEYAFSHTSLRSITLPTGIQSIGVETFNDCQMLKSIVIPNSVKEIEESAFEGCHTLETVKMSENIERIEDSAFSGCTRLKSIDLGNKLNYLGEAVFKDCISLENIGDNTVIPGLRIYDDYFREEFQTIGLRTFRNCISLTSVKLREDVQLIGRGSFQGCTSLCSVNIPSGVTIINDDAFAGCISIPSIKLPDQIQTIGYGTFYACNTIKSIHIPSSVSSISYKAFICRNLKYVHVEGKIPPTRMTSGNFFPMFSTSTKQNGILYVPDGCVPQYRTAVEWKDFKNIADESSSGIDKIKISDMSESDISVNVGSNGINISDIPSGSTVSIYSLDSTLFYSDTIIGDRMTYRPTASGIYIIRIGDYSTKVLFK